MNALREWALRVTQLVKEECPSAELCLVGDRYWRIEVQPAELAEWLGDDMMDLATLMTMGIPVVAVGP